MQYRKKSIVIEAMRWDGTVSSASEIADAFNMFCSWHAEHSLEIPTLEGTMTASPGDYIIKGIGGEYYLCKPDIFEMTYEPVPKEKTMTLEEEIVAKGLTAPRITPADVEANISSEYYFTAGEGAIGSVYASTPKDRTFNGTSYHQSLNLLTFCVLVTHNGFTVTGESACASPENFDAEIGRKIARGNAIDKLWPLMGYELKTKLNQ